MFSKSDIEYPYDLIGRRTQMGFTSVRLSEYKIFAFRDRLTQHVAGRVNARWRPRSAADLRTQAPRPRRVRRPVRSLARFAALRRGLGLERA